MGIEPLLDLEDAGWQCGYVELENAVLRARVGGAEEAFELLPGKLGDLKDCVGGGFIAVHKQHIPASGFAAANDGVNLAILGAELAAVYDGKLAPNQNGSFGKAYASTCLTRRRTPKESLIQWSEAKAQAVSRDF